MESAELNVRFFPSIFPAMSLMAALLLSVGCAADDTTRPSPSAETDFVSESGRITVSQVRQMSVVIQAPEGVIYADPTGGGDAYADHPAPDVILISHEHTDNFDVATVEDLVGPETHLVAPEAVIDVLPEGLREHAVPLANGQRSELGDLMVEAVPAYGIQGEAEQWHPRGRGNGYVVTADGERLYIAGSTEATPEMLALEDIYLALLPLYPPYALGPEDAVSAVSTFGPQVAFVYQYNNQRTRDTFVRGVEDAPLSTSVIAPDISS